MLSEAIIKVENISKMYKLYEKPADRFYEWLTGKTRHNTVQSLKDVSFSINKGETMGIIGRNGAGKSTILQIIAGTLSPTSGRVEVNGRVVALLELGAGFNMEYTGKENIMLYGSILGLSKEEILNRYDDILEFADIGEFVNYPVKTYSSGMFVRLAFSVAINVNPEILIVDEALSVGDVQFQHKCIAKLKELQANGCTILFVSHDIDTVKSFCNSAILLHKGRVELIDSPEEVSKRYLELIHREQIEKRKQNQSNAFGKYMVEDLQEEWYRDTFTGSTRHGLGEAIVQRVILRDARNFDLDRVKFGESLNITLLIEYQKDIATEINVGILFKDDKGIDVLGNDSWNQQLLIPRGQTGSRFKMDVNIPNVWLKPGSYSLTFALGAMSDDRQVWNEYYYDWIERAKILTVETKEDVRVWTKVLLPMEIKLM